MRTDTGEAMKFLSGIVFTVAAAAVGGAAILATGVLNPAAAVPPGPLETRLARFALDRAVERRAPSGKSPVKPGPEAFQAGLAQYRRLCLDCHGAPGVDPSPAAEGLNPPAPDLTLGRVQRRTDGELFWLVQNGVRMTGMPAFGGSTKDEEIWKIVAFLRKLPALSPEEEKALRGALAAAD